MGSSDNFHHAIVRRIQSGKLSLGISKMAGAQPSSVAFSRFWTAFVFLAPGTYIAVPWYFDFALFWGYVIFSPGVLILGVLIRRNRGRAKARSLAMSDSLAFAHLWDEGALSLKSPDRAEVCMSPQDDYRQFMSQNFLLNRREPQRGRPISEIFTAEA